MPLLFRLFHEIKPEEILPRLFYKAIITLIPKSYKDPTIEEKTNIPFKHIFKKFQ